MSAAPGPPDGTSAMSVDDLVKEATSELWLRFSVVTMLPNFVFIGTMALLLYSGAPGTAPDLSTLEKIKDISIVSGVLLLLAVFLLSLIVHPFQFLLIRVLEGYWGEKRLGGMFRKWAVKRQKTVRDKSKNELTRILSELKKPLDLETKSALTRKAAALSTHLQQYYPVSERMMPTRLGNILRAAEDQAGKPYGLDAVTIWPRLYPVLPKEFRERLDQQRLQLDICVRYSITLLVTAIGSALLLYRYLWWMSLPLGFLLLAYLSYRSACSAALLYGQALKVAFDLYRFDLTKALHLPLPATLHKERVANYALCDFLRQGKETDFNYLHSSTPSASDAPKSSGS